MATIRKTITLTNQQGTWIKSRIEDGQYTNESEYVRDLIRRDQQRNSELESLRTELIKGEQSGISDRMPEDIIKAVLADKQ